MQKLTEAAFRRRLDELKNRLVSADAFEPLLNALYTRLLRTRQEELILRADNYLRLLLPPKQHSRLAHPAMVQALAAAGYYQKASRLEKQFSSAAQELLPYTPFAALSKHAGKTASFIKEGAYNAQLAALARLPAALKKLALRDFKELTANYAQGHYKAVIVLAGSLLEILLIARLKKLKITHVKNTNPGTHESKPLLKANLNELLACAQEHHLLAENKLRLTQAARICRNLIHPGREIATRQTACANKAEICFLSVLEMLDALAVPSNKL